MVTPPSPSGRSLAGAIEENAAEFLLAMGRAGGGEERRGPRVRWIIGGTPLDPPPAAGEAPIRCRIDYQSAVVYANLTPDEAEVEIERFKARLRAAGVPGTWHVGPSMRPADLRARLAAHGFGGSPEPGTGEPGLAADLRELPESVAVPPGFAVERVRDAAALDALRQTLADGFGEGEVEGDWVAEIYRRIGLGDDVPWRHFLGRLHGAPVATASIFFAAGACGLYFVNVRPAYRRRGLGTAITLAALQAGGAAGFTTGVLGASAMGYRVYQRLGFREYCRIGICEWAPPASTD
jgi:GNAT superfamily N-acetyltransferase